jgi:hypothetical protein
MTHFSFISECFLKKMSPNFGIHAALISCCSIFMPVAQLANSATGCLEYQTRCAAAGSSSTSQCLMKSTAYKPRSHKLHVQQSAVFWLNPHFRQELTRCKCYVYSCLSYVTAPRHACALTVRFKPL